MGEGTSGDGFVAELLAEYRVPLVLMAASVACIGFGILIFVKSFSIAEPIRFSDAGESTASGKTSGALSVDVAGAVKVPGVYRLGKDARVDDAIAAAGGLTGDADTILIEKAINRASKLSDGAKLYIPRADEGESSNTSHKNSFATNGEQAELNSAILGVSDILPNKSDPSFISVNTASQSELESLNGVGPVTAGKIISGRPYTDLNQLVEKKTMSASLFAKLTGQLSL